MKVSVEHDGERVLSVKIHGDFFLHPEEKVSELEKALEGVPLEEEALKQKIGSFLQDVQVFGFEAEDLAKAVMQAGGKI